MLLCAISGMHLSSSVATGERMSDTKHLQWRCACFAILGLEDGSMVWMLSLLRADPRLYKINNRFLLPRVLYH